MNLLVFGLIFVTGPELLPPPIILEPDPAADSILVVARFGGNRSQAYENWKQASAQVEWLEANAWQFPGRASLWQSCLDDCKARRRIWSDIDDIIYFWTIDQMEGPGSYREKCRRRIREATSLVRSTLGEENFWLGKFPYPVIHWQ